MVADNCLINTIPVTMDVNFKVKAMIKESQETEQRIPGLKRRIFITQCECPSRVYFE